MIDLEQLSRKMRHIGLPLIIFLSTLAQVFEIYIYIYKF